MFEKLKAKAKQSVVASSSEPVKPLLTKKLVLTKKPKPVVVSSSEQSVAPPPKPTGRPPKGERAMTNAERQRLWRQNRKNK